MVAVGPMMHEASSLPLPPPSAIALLYQLRNGDGGIAPITNQRNGGNSGNSRSRGNSNNRGGNSTGNKPASNASHNKSSGHILGGRSAAPDTSARGTARRSQAQSDVVPAHMY
jgi:hypothetical protein